MIHVYCFHNVVVASQEILQEVREALGFEIQESELSIYDVRDVAPNKVHVVIDVADRRKCFVVHSDFRLK